MSERKRLTPQQSRRVNGLIKKTCCNCIDGNCILLDDGEPCVCPQIISYSLLCKWFCAAVLPADKLLYAELYQQEGKRYAARPLRPARIMSNTARTAGGALPADKPPSVCEKSAARLRSRGKKSLVPCGFADAKNTKQGIATYSRKSSVLLRNK